MLRVILVTVFVKLLPSVSAQCEIEPVISNSSPLIIASGTTDFVYPAPGQRTISLNGNDVIEFACPGQNVLLDGVSTQRSIVEATCISNARFSVNGNRFLWRQITCDDDPVATARFTGQSCGTIGKEAEVGFQLASNRFAQSQTVCFDTSAQNTLYTGFIIPASVNSRSVVVPRPYFHEDPGFYNIGNRKVDNLYVRGTQRQTINRLLGLSNKNTKYIQNGSMYFLSRGHLAARADFLYPAQMNATFKFINAAPQWQSFNGYNWEEAESDTRAYATVRKVNLQIWTGTYGVAALPHEDTREDTELYLYVNGNNRGIPVPALYWKIVYNPSNRQGIVLIGINNPYEKSVGKYKICNDVSGNVNWLKWNKTSVMYGYSYACTVPDFNRVVTYAPSLSVSGLLT